MKKIIRKGPLVQRVAKRIGLSLAGGKRTTDYVAAKLTGGLLLVLALLLSCVTPALAADGNVTYSGDAGEFIFTPGSEYSPTDLFPNFKDVMPGDSITQTITVRNDASNKVKVKIYMRALGAHPESVEFLSKLHLTVEKSQDNTMEWMFDAQADQVGQLGEWVCLGTLYSGGEVNLLVTLDVPVELDNQFRELVGYLDWEFRVDEFEIEPTDPEPPQTGDRTNLLLWGGLLIASMVILVVLIILRHRKDEENDE